MQTSVTFWPTFRNSFMHKSTHYSEAHTDRSRHMLLDMLTSRDSAPPRHPKVDVKKLHSKLDQSGRPITPQAHAGKRRLSDDLSTKQTLPCVPQGFLSLQLILLSPSILLAKPLKANFPHTFSFAIVYYSFSRLLTWSPLFYQYQ